MDMPAAGRLMVPPAEEMTLVAEIELESAVWRWTTGNKRFERVVVTVWTSPPSRLALTAGDAGAGAATVATGVVSGARGAEMFSGVQAVARRMTPTPVIRERSIAGLVMDLVLVSG
jgi:hypothetical protein